jgi:hypothetical protein
MIRCNPFLYTEFNRVNNQQLYQLDVENNISRAACLLPSHRTAELRHLDRLYRQNFSADFLLTEHWDKKISPKEHANYVRLESAHRLSIAIGF